MADTNPAGEDGASAGSAAPPTGSPALPTLRSGPGALPSPPTAVSSAQGAPRVAQSQQPSPTTAVAATADTKSSKPDPSDAAATPTEGEVVAKLLQVLAGADLESTTVKGIRRQLEAHFGVSLTPMKSLIKERIVEYMTNLKSVAPEDGAGVGDASDGGDGGDDNDDDDDDDDGDDDDDNDDDDDEEAEAMDAVATTSTAALDETEEERNERLSRELALQLQAEEEALMRGGRGRKRRVSSKYAEPRKRQKRSSTKKPGSKKRTFGGTKNKQLAPPLAAFMGTEFAPYNDVRQRLKDYINEHDLKNPKKRSEVLLDDTLQSIFKRKKFTLFSMEKYLSPMCKNPEDLVDVPGAVEAAAAAKAAKKAKKSAAKAKKKKDKKKKKKDKKKSKKKKSKKGASSESS